MITFDWTISISDLLLLGGGILSFAIVVLRNLNTLRDLITLVKDHEERLGRLETDRDTHHDWLIRAGLDRKGNH